MPRKAATKTTKRRTYTAEERAAYGKRMAACRKRAAAASAKAAPKKRKGLRGHGDYFDDAAGQVLSHGLPMVIKALTGFGDYNVNSNSLMVPKLGGDPPIVRNTNGGFVVHHREYMADITASTSFNIKTIPINPGLLGSFPGFQVADSYEQYEMRGLVYEYKSMSSDAVMSSGASSALGTVIFATQYNSSINLSRISEPWKIMSLLIQQSQAPVCFIQLNVKEVKPRLTSCTFERKNLPAETFECMILVHSPTQHRGCRMRHLGK